MKRAILACVIVMLCFVPTVALAQTAPSVPSISNNLPPYPDGTPIPIAPQTSVTAPAPNASQQTTPAISMRPMDASDPPTTPGGPIDSGLMGWLKGLFDPSGLQGSAINFGLVIAVSFVAVLLVWQCLQSYFQGRLTQLPQVFGAAIGAFISALPMLVFIAKYATFANIGVSAACNAALGAANAMGDTIQTVGGASLSSTQVCDGQLNPVGVLELAGNFTGALFSMKIPIPVESSGGVWGWVLGPIAELGNNVLASGIVLFSWAAVCGCLIYIAIEIAMIAVEALFGTTFCPAFLGFSFIPPLAHLANGAKAYLPQLAIRIFFLLLPAGIGFFVLESELAIVKSGTMSPADLLALIGSCAFFVIAMLRMKKIAKAIIEGQSTMSTMEDVVKPAVMAAVEAASIAIAGYGALSLLGAGAGGGAAALGAGGAGPEVMDLGRATPFSGFGGGTTTAPGPVGGYLPPPRYDIVPSEAMRMEPPLALPAPQEVSQRPRSGDSGPTTTGGATTPTPPKTPGGAGATDANAAPAASPPSDASFTAPDDRFPSEVPPTFSDLRPPTSPGPAVTYETPPEIRKQGEGAAVSWELADAERLRQEAAARRAQRASQQPSRDAGHSNSGARSTAGPASSADRGAFAPSPPVATPGGPSYESAPPPDVSSDAGPAHRGAGAGHDAPFIDAPYRDLSHPQSERAVTPPTPQAPPSKPRTAPQKFLSIAQRYLQLRAMTSPRYGGRAYAALQGLNLIEEHLNSREEEPE